MSGDQPLINISFVNSMPHKYPAMVVSGPGKTPRLQRLTSQPLEPEQVRISIQSCALNFADLLMVRGKYQDMPSFPLTPGMEISGEVIETGSQISQFQPQDPVIAFCGSGGLANEIVIDAARCLRRSDSLDAVIGSVFPIAYGTSHLALTRRAQLKKSERLVVLGAGGGVGLTAVEIGAALGAHVTAVARGAEKLASAKTAGADVLIDSDVTPDLRAAILSDGSTHVIYDAVGGPLGDAAMRTLGPVGRYVLIGFASGTLPQLKANHMLVKNVSTIGFNLSGYMTFRPDLFTDSLTELMDWHAAGRLHPQISHILPLERAADGLDILKDRAVTGKIVVTP